MADVKKTIQIDIVTNKTNLKNFDKDAQSAKQSIDAVNKSTGAGIGALDKFSGGAVTAFRGIISGTRNAVIAMKTLKGAIISTGIGALVVAVGSLYAYFSKTEEGAQKLRIAMAALEVIVDTLIDVFVQLGEKSVAAFDNPKKAVKEFGDFILRYFTEIIPNAVNQLVGSLGTIGEAIWSLMKGDWENAIKLGKQGVVDMTGALYDMSPAGAVLNELGVDFGEIADKIEENVEAAIKLQKLQNELIRQERIFIVARAETNKVIAEARLIAEDENRTLEERLEKLKEAARLEEEMTAKELKHEQTKLYVMVEQSKLTATDEETLKRIAEQRAKVIDLQTASLRTQRRLATEITTFEKEIEQRRIKELEDKKAREDAWTEYYKNQEAIRLEIMAEGIDKELAMLDAKYNALFEKAAGNAELEKELIEAQERDIQAIQDKYAEEQRKKEEDRAKQELEDARWLMNAKLDMTTQSLQLADEITNLFVAKNEKQARTQFNISKGLRLAEATISAIQGAQNAFTAAQANIPATVGSFGAYPFIQAGLAAGFGAVKVAMIAKQKFQPSGDGGGGGGDAGAGGGASPMPAPQFNIVGAGATNQLSQSIADQNAKPVKAYVVANDVTTMQALDRNRRNQSAFP